MDREDGSPVTFGLLGTVEVRVAGRPPVTLPPANRALLARLLLAAGRVVAADTLTDALWAGAPPADAANALQLRVSKLRRALAGAGAGADLVVTRAPGYLLAVPGDAVDAHRFERLLAQARAERDPTAALARFDAALALWRGPALADVPDAGWVATEGGRLEELRLGAVEDRLELLLDAGRQAAALPDLERLVAAHPLRERAHRLLMLARYRAGRQADALTAYHALRRRLADELGIDPGPELRALAEAILRQQVPPAAAPPRPAPAATSPAAAPPAAGQRPAVAASALVGGTAPPGPPDGALLPRRLTSMVGRDADLRRVRERLDGAGVVTLTGPGGVGKTTLALEVARRFQAELPVHLVRLAAVPAGADLPAAVAGQLQVAGGTGDAATAAVAARLGREPALLVVDNCEHLVDEVAALVERLVDGCPALRVLATSREALAVPGETQLAVAPLAVPEEAAQAAASPAVRLFVDRARAVRPDFALDAATTPAVVEICRQLDGMPLAIELAAARVKALPPAEIAARLHDRFALLTAGARTAEARHRTLRATLDWSHELLTDAERRLLRRLAVFRGGWDLAAAERVCAFAGLAAEEVLDLLFRLVDRSLVVPDPASGRMRLLVTVREYAAGRLDEAGEREQTRQRHVAHFTELAERYGPSARAGGDAWARLVAEHDNLRAAVDFCLARPDGTAAGLRLARALYPFWSYGLRDEGIRALTALVDTGRLTPAERAAALQRVGLLGVYYPTPVTRAASREALELHERLGDAGNAAISGLALAWEGQYDGDLDRHRRLVERARAELADPWWSAMTWYVEALLDLRAGAFDRSADRWTHCLDLLARTEDRLLVAGIHAHLGVALREGGRGDEALRALTEAVGAARAVTASPHALAFSLVQLAHTRLDRDDAGDVPALLAEADDTARRSGNPRCRAWAAWGRARIAYAGGDPVRAVEGCRTALALFEEREFPWARRRLWQLTADAAADAGQPDEARRARQAAENLA
ncbi:winged helix-turn-helix domain-containing protein [Micromonospora sp. PLK6-60]|uniref:AfsR/SARP family transcriptional regulator n=1 Tax=Micromonospora sp. PLK6-60 TaxID=2873383 RepID=UPI001CA7AAE5|nr:BTAD domain-containing putative transcriptional regulator [Micromonospora sp. PLK6-60]MBY8874586.1 winged helix-turn-helix domain-containing protein [Micromonospora sp. PLK6-60]